MSDSVKASTGRSLCLVPKLTGTGGTASFQLKMRRGLTERGIPTTFELDDTSVRAALVVGGTRDLIGLWRARRKGVRIVQRLDGINWIHRKRRTGLRHYLKAERANLLLSWIRNHIAHGVIYQSHFVHQWWETVYGLTAAPHTVIYNGVDLDRYTPSGLAVDPPEGVRLLVVEGRLAGGYDLGLEHAMEFAAMLGDRYPKPVELMIVGEVAPEVMRSSDAKSRVPIRWAGTVPRDRIPEIDRSAHLLFAADIHPACPNSVIESLACGLPVVGFDTGALSEIVNAESGMVVPYGSDSWELERPDFEALVRAAEMVLEDIEAFRAGARRRAEERFGLDRMVNDYLEAIGW
jgi:glycosyltransferase involved in cell wall biosynthesis